MDNNNNNQIFEEEGWPNDVYGFLRGTRPHGLNLWVTFLLEEKVKLNNANTCNEKQGRFLHIGKKEKNKRDEEQKSVTEEEEGRNTEEEGLSDEEHYNPYIQLYADSCDWGYGDGMPEAWRQ